ncbi:MAG TPA: PEGA domain-containing protein [Candidatus Eisenbacteria bacterium]|nr:PEGA domain-containing protein [Candidatus Eisenbacteria bacterium]
MHPRTRTIVTWLFVLAFFATAPVLIMFTSGYRYNWKRQRVQKTGLIQAETVPTGAKVFLDGSLQRKTTPASYTRLLPDDYLVRIEKKGYLPWEKTLEVKSGQTTFATNIVLYRDALARLVLERRAGTAAWSPDGTDVALLTDDGDWKELVALADGKGPVLLARFARDAYADESLAWSPDGTAVLFTANAGGATHAMRFLPSAPNEALSVHENFPKGPLAVHWNAGGASLMVVSTLGAFTVDSATGAVSPVRLEAGIKDAVDAGRSTYVLRAERKNATASVMLERLSGESSETVLQLAAGDYRFLPGDDRKLLVAEKRKRRIILVDAASGASDAFDATGAVWEPKGRRLLLWNDFEIYTVDPADGSRDLITRLGTPIASCAWSPAGEAIIFSTANGIAAAELDDRDHRNVFDLIRFTDVGPFAVDANAGMLRFIGSAGTKSGVYERDL